MTEQCEPLSIASQVLLMASQTMMPKTFKAAIKEGADMNAKRCGDGYSALLFSAWHGHFQNIKVLVENGVDINIESNEKATAVMLAAQQGFYEIVAYLIKKKADINRQAITGDTALSVAEECGHKKIVRLIKKNIQR